MDGLMLGIWKALNKLEINILYKPRNKAFLNLKSQTYSRRQIATEYWFERSSIIRMNQALQRVQQHKRKTPFLGFCIVKLCHNRYHNG